IDLSPTFGHEPGFERELLVTKLNGQQVLKKSYNTSPWYTKCHVDLWDQPAGAYELTINIVHKTLRYTFFLDPDPINRARFGYFEWFALRLPGAFPTPEGAEVPPPARIKFGEHYHFEFRSRETQWKYYLIRTTRHRLTQLEIAYYFERKKKFEFEKCEDRVVLPNGMEAIEFIASKPLPYSEYPAGEVILKAVEFSRDYQLPFASPGGYAPATDPNQDKSNIYIYL
ncbi:MAG: hypothetical protein AAF570_19880, partial [Bacteroidota bacterium]